MKSSLEKQAEEAMKWFTTALVTVAMLFLVAACEGTKISKDDTDVPTGDEDLIVSDELATDEEELEEDETVKDDGPVIKDDGTTSKDDGPVVTDDGEEEPDDALVEPDDAVVEPDDALVEPDDAIIVPDEETMPVYYTIDWCNLQYPADATVTQGDNITYYGRVYIAGLTDLTAEVDAYPEVIGQLSGNPSSSVDASTWPADGWIDLLPNPDNETATGIGSNDEYMIEVPVMVDPGAMDVTIRFSGDSGQTWIYCNANREGSEGYNGTDATHPYDPAKHGHLTVIAYDDPCLPDNPCTALHQTACTDADHDEAPECNCDENYTFDGGDTCINEKEVSCDTDNGNPLNSEDIVANVTITYTTAVGWSDPADCAWECMDDYALEGGACINQKDVACDPDNDNPVNSHDMVVDVTVHYTDATDWEPPADCAWECDDTYVKDAYDACVPEAGPCAASPCTEEHKHVCTETGEDPFYVCSCDEHYNDDDMNGSCEPDTQTVPCSNTPSTNAHWVDFLPTYDGSGGLVQTWVGPGDDDWAPATDTCPWECDIDYTLDGGDVCIHEKQVDCASTPAKPEYAHDIIEQVTIRFWSATDWESPEDCDWECDADYHWNEDEGACLETLTIGWCNLQGPADANWWRGQVVTVYSRVYVDGLTDQTTEVDAVPQLIVQIGSGEAGTSATEWLYWGPTAPNPDNEISPDIGDNDEYMYDGPVTETLGAWDFVVRVSGDSGVTWTYCNANRPGEGYNGTDIGHPYDPDKNGHFTVTSPCGEGFCNEPHKTVCADSDDDPFYTCSCDEHYNDDDGNGTCEPDVTMVPCVAKPLDSHWVEDLPIYNGVGDLYQTWDGDSWEPGNDTCPWECDEMHHQENDTCESNFRDDHACENSKPENSHWIAEGPYNGDGTVDQTWEGSGYEPPADECPWACDETYHQEGQLCVSDTQLIACTNSLPLDAMWRTEGVYGGGSLTQTWDGDSWEPATDTCPWDCDEAYHEDGGACVANVRLVGCGFELPSGGAWVDSLPTYDGLGNLTQTWNPGTGEYEPADTTCPFDCTMPGYHPNNEVHECLMTYAIGWCNTQSPASHVGLLDSWVNVYGRLYIAGVTDASTITYPDIDPLLPQVKAQLGAGPRDTIPNGDDWDWLDASPNGDYGDNDEYVLNVQLQLPPGLYDYAYRFSGDSGQTWTYCDLNGSADGYTTDQAGKLMVMCSQNTDCNGNPAGPICAPWSMCVECMDGSDCEAWEDCNANVCELQAGRCNEDADCVADGKVCDMGDHICKLPGKLVINEVDYDQYSTDTAEYIEIFNSGEMSYDLTGVSIELWNGSNNSIYVTYDLAVNDQAITQVMPGQYYVVSYSAVTSPVNDVCPSCLTKTVASGFIIQNGDPDGMQIMDDGLLVDGLHYVDPMNTMTVGEGSTAPDDNASSTDLLSIGRCPNGADTDDNGADFVVMTSTPGAANTCP